MFLLPISFSLKLIGFFAEFHIVSFQDWFMVFSETGALPACAYVAIRKEFPVRKDEHFTGFDLDEED